MKKCISKTAIKDKVSYLEGYLAQSIFNIIAPQIVMQNICAGFKRKSFFVWKGQQHCFPLNTNVSARSCALCTKRHNTIVCQLNFTEAIIILCLRY